MTQLETIKKMAQILYAIETFIHHNQANLPQQRSRLIDRCAISLGEYEDSFFTYDQLKNLSTHMIDRHIANDVSWTIDVAQCTEENVSVMNIKTHEHITVPLNVFFASTCLPNVSTSMTAH
jgi:hypothetical protein